MQLWSPHASIHAILMTIVTHSMTNYNLIVLELSLDQVYV